MNAAKSIFLLAVLLATPLGATQSPLPELPLIAQGEGVWRLPAGEHHARLVIDQPMTLQCEPGAILDAGGQGSAITIAAADVTVEGCTVRNWGVNLTELDSAFFLRPEAQGAALRDNVLRGPGSGVWVDSTPDVTIENNDIEGVEAIRSQDRGNAIHLFAARGARVEGNRVRHARDGIYIDTSNGNELAGNVLEDVRYGIHYMFSHDNIVRDNVTRRTRTGYALMQSKRLTVTGNRSEDDQNYGILMNFITHSTIVGNVVTGVRQGSTGDVMIQGAEGKALFIYNSLFNRIEDNRFERSSLGIHLTAGSENNVIVGNAFVANRQQVKYVATRRQDWSADGRGNYWSDYLGWDRDADGIGDVAYEPNDGVDRLLWMYPQARLLMNSPAIELLRWVQRAFPVTRSPGVQDSRPLMHPPAAAQLAQAKETQP